MRRSCLQRVGSARNMKRLIFNVMADVMLIFSAAALFLWVRSYRYSDAVHWLKQEHRAEQDEGFWAEIYSGKGTIEFSWKDYRMIPPRPENPRWRLRYENGWSPRAMDVPRMYI